MSGTAPYYTQVFPPLLGAARLVGPLPCCRTLVTGRLSGHA
jgi:hypothetical protein